MCGRPFTVELELLVALAQAGLPEPDPCPWCCPALYAKAPS